MWKNLRGTRGKILTDYQDNFDLVAKWCSKYFQLGFFCCSVVHVHMHSWVNALIKTHYVTDYVILVKITFSLVKVLCPRSIVS